MSWLFVPLALAAELEAVDHADDKQPLVGLFAEGNMPVRWTGPKASRHGNIDRPAITCQPNTERTAATPTLAEMTARRSRC